MLHYGDVVYANPDPSVGHEQTKRRPLIVVSSDHFNTHCNLTFIVPVTSTDNGYPMHVPVTNVKLADGTTLNGFAAVEQTKSLDLNARNAEQVGTAPDELMSRITDILLSCLLRDDLIILSSE